MRLLPCRPPQGVLEPAPRTSLRTDTTRERWEGFWCLADESYYTRCTRSDGSAQWFRIADEHVRRSVADPLAPRVLTLRPRGRRAPSAQRMVLVSSDGRRSMLVGTSRRDHASGERRPGGTR